MIILKCIILEKGINKTSIEIMTIIIIIRKIINLMIT